MFFSPAGWDNEKKISILYENLNTMKADDCFEDVITKPITRKVLIYKHKKITVFLDLICKMQINIEILLHKTKKCDFFFSY